MYIIESDLSRPEQQDFKGIKKLGIKMQQAFQQFISIMHQGKSGVMILLAAIWAKISVIAAGTELKITVGAYVLFYFFSGHILYGRLQNNKD